MKETPTSAVNRDDESLGSPAIKLFKPVTPRKLGMKCPPSLRNRIQSTCLDDAAHLRRLILDLHPDFAVAAVGQVGACDNVKRASIRWIPSSDASPNWGARRACFGSSASICPDVLRADKPICLDR